jgi:hypothetical protein
VEASALAAAAEQLSALCTAAGDFGIPEPAAGGWQGLEARVHAIALGQAPPAAAAADGTTLPGEQHHDMGTMRVQACHVAQLQKGPLGAARGRPPVHEHDLGLRHR